MKTTKLFRKFSIIAASLLLVLLISYSCEKDDPAKLGEGTLTAKVDGKKVTTLSMVTFANRAGHYFSIQGNTGGTSSEAFSLQVLLGFDGVGTYKIGGGANINAVATYIATKVDLGNPTKPDVQTWQAPYDDTLAGELVITEISETNVKGTFHYKAKNTTGDGSVKSITDGKFNVKIQ